MFEGDLGLQGPLQLQDPSFLSSLSGQQEKDLSEDLDLSFLPDELSTQDERAQDSMQDVSQDQHTLNDSGVFTGSAPAEVTAATPVAVVGPGGEVPPAASPFCSLPMSPMTPMAPMTPLTESSKIIPQLQCVTLLYFGRVLHWVE